MQHTLWTVVIPVKGTSEAKSRLQHEAWRADTIAIATLFAAMDWWAVAEIVVVAPEKWMDYNITGLPFTRVIDQGEGLDAAVELGIERAGRTRPVAVLLGDLPALQSDELGDALTRAALLDRSFVADREGTGTTLIASTSDHAPAFGAGSAQRHRDNGYVELDVPVDSGLRSDVDTLEQLEALAGRWPER